jgi:hypothetical protein
MPVLTFLHGQWGEVDVYVSANYARAIDLRKA